jgi:hypothetical protein
VWTRARGETAEIAQREGLYGVAVKGAVRFVVPVLGLVKVVPDDGLAPTVPLELLQRKTMSLDWVGAAARGGES